MDFVLLLLLLAALALFARWFLGVGTGAPYLPVRSRDIRDFLAIVDVGPADTVVDLGSGDGRILRAAAEKGARVIGYELNPFLVWWSRRKLRKYGDRAVIYRMDLRKARLEHATVIAVFQLTHMMPVVKQLWREQAPRAKLVSFAFHLEEEIPAAKQGIVFVYRQTSRGGF